MKSESDLRTKRGQEIAILNQIRKYGGFGIFWITENQKRAVACERLESSGRIIRTGGAYPWCAYEIAGDQ